MMLLHTRSTACTALAHTSHPNPTVTISRHVNTTQASPLLSPRHSRHSLHILARTFPTPTPLPPEVLTMCHYHRTLCSTCHVTIYSSPINCGKGLAILGPPGLTIECPDYDPDNVPEQVEEKLCEQCVKEAVYDGRPGSDWDSFLAWRRKRDGEYDL